ncbi:MAG: LptF/LptG family permease [Balneolaceae bacterium]|nr:LptF/LptG family permease [Balneolaceae bacterium]MCH8548704.1 LptF/LptG family permease [Balneolaceae bacterium]
MNRLDRYIFFRLSAIAIFVLVMLICIFIIVDFSENSDDFVDKGASLIDIWRLYYLNYIPEMIRLVSPLAVLIACLYLTVQLTERLEITAIKASGISLYRLSLPYLFFGLCIAGTVSYLDGYVIPVSNAERIAFEREYLSGGSADRIDRGGIFRQESDSTILNINFYDANANVGYRTTYVEFDGDQIKRMVTANRITWVDSTQTWITDRARDRVFEKTKFEETSSERMELDLNILPRDLARRSSDIYQLNYPDALEYIDSIRRIGAGGITLPQVQLFSRMAYPVSIVVLALIGFALATERRKGGKGVYIALGFSISFIYLAIMKIIEPFGIAGTVTPEFAAIFPHVFFACIAILMLLLAKK